MARTSLALGLTAVLAAAALPALTGQSLSRSHAEYTVHEWGTFTSIAGEDGRAVSWLPLAGPADLPCFVEEAFATAVKTSIRATVRMETPVLYFYAAAPMIADVRVRFPDGLLTEFYPHATGMRDQLRWRDVRVTPGADPAFPVEPEPNHYYAARATDAAPVRVGAQDEKFLFYRGAGGVRLPLTATVADDGTIAAVNTSGEDIPSVVLFERRGARIGYRVIGALSGRATVEPIALDGDEESMRAALEATLIEQGLYPREAAAMLETWRDTWFEEGTRLFYIVPKPAVERALPLDIRPRPSHIERVFVGRLELLTPGRLQALRETLLRADVDGLAAHGRFLMPFAERVLAASAPGDERARLSAALERAMAALTGGAALGRCGVPTSS